MLTYTDSVHIVALEPNGLEQTIVTHNRIAEQDLDIRFIMPMGFKENFNLDTFENIVLTPEFIKENLKYVQSPEQLLKGNADINIIETQTSVSEEAVVKNPILADMDLADNAEFKVAAFIIKESCEMNKAQGMFLPERFVIVMLLEEDGHDLEEQILAYEGQKFYAPNDVDVIRFVQKSFAMYETHIANAIDTYLDQIGLDYKFDDIETEVPREVLLKAKEWFGSVADQYPNNPLYRHTPYQTMSDEMRTMYELCYSENKIHHDKAYLERWGGRELDEDAYALMDRIKARICIYHPSDVPSKFQKRWNEECIHVHRGAIFVPITHFNYEFISHIIDDVERRLEELKMFFDELEDE